MNRLLKILVGAALMVLGVVLFVMHFVPAGRDLMAAYDVPDFVHWLGASLALFIGIAVLISGLAAGHRRGPEED